MGRVRKRPAAGRRPALDAEWGGSPLRDGVVSRALAAVPRRAAVLWAVLVPAARAAARVPLTVQGIGPLADCLIRAAWQVIEPTPAGAEAVLAAQTELVTKLAVGSPQEDQSDLTPLEKRKAREAGLFALAAVRRLATSPQAGPGLSPVVHGAVVTAGTTNTGTGWVSAENAEWKYLRQTFRRCAGPAAAFDPAWRTADAVALARGVLATGDAGSLPMLADALEEAGCPAGHLDPLRRDPRHHTPADWAVWNLLLPESSEGVTGG